MPTWCACRGGQQGRQQRAAGHWTRHGQQRRQVEVQNSDGQSTWANHRSSGRFVCHSLMTAHLLGYFLFIIYYLPLFSFEKKKELKKERRNRARQEKKKRKAISTAADRLWNGHLRQIRLLEH